MRQQIYAIRDTKGEMYNQPWFCLTHGEAERNFHQIVSDPNSKLSKYPEDFDLYHIGQFDVLTGKIDGLPAPSHVVKAVDIKTKLNALNN